MKKVIEHGITVLTADTGMKLTNGSAFGSVVYLGVHDAEENWNEITEMEAEERMKEQEQIVD